MGKIIAIEGIDGCGKATLTKGLCDRLSELGKSSTSMSFPTYSQRPYGRRVTDYLNGKLGMRREVSPSLVGLLYAGDRLEAKAELQDKVCRYDYLILDRYYASSRVYQGLQIAPHLQQDYWSWMDQVEFQSHGIPKPDVTILLDLHPEVAAERVAARGTKDIHEVDQNFLDRVRYGYLEYALNQHGWFIVSAEQAPEDVVSEALTIITRL